MEKRRNYIERIIAENAKNEIEAIAIEEEIGVPTPNNDLPNLKKDRIVLDLVNRTPNDSEISLLALPTGTNTSQGINYGDLFITKYSETLIPIADIDAGLATYTIEWIDENGTPRSYTTAALETITALVSDLNSSLSVRDSFDYKEIGLNYLLFKKPIETWVYWTPPLPSETRPSGTQPADFYTENAFSSIINDIIQIPYIFTTYDVIGGTGISVTEITGNMTYEELVQGIRNNLEPYFFNEMTVYANNIEQANVPVKKVIRGMAGTTRTMIDNATIFNQNQFVTSEEISIAPRTLNEIDYKIKASESVRIIINYTKGNLNAIAETIDAYIEEGVPFNVAITQLPKAVSEKEKEYLEETLKSVWERKKRELKREGISIDIDSIFTPQKLINSTNRDILGKKMKAVKNHIEKSQKKSSLNKNLSPNNIKNIVANYVAKGDADEIFDPYSYIEG